MEKRKIKILYVNHVGNVMGGAEHSLSVTLKNLNKKIFSPILLLPDYGPVYDHFVSIGIETYVMPVNYMWLPSSRQYYRLLRDVKTRMNWFNEIIYRENIDIIHTNDEEAFDGAIAAKIHGIPHVWSIRHQFINNAQPIFDYFPVHEFGMGKFINKFSDKVLVVSEAVRSSLEHYIEPEKLFVQCNAFEMEKYENIAIKNDIRKELKIPPETLLICSIGRICKEKGFDVYLDAAAHVLKHRKDVKFLIIGQEIGRDIVRKLKEQIRELQIDDFIYLLGFRNDISEILQQIDIFTLASSTEGLPRVVAEAMASKKPVVVTGFHSANEIVSDGETGYIVPINRADMIAEKLLTLLDAPQLRLKMGEMGKKIIREKFSVGHHINKIETLYYELAEAGRNSQEVNITAKLFVNILGEIGDIGLKLTDYEDRIQRLESLQDKIKNNFLYKGIKKLYKMLKHE